MSNSKQSKSIQEKIISPIAIDLGAKNTGVYFNHYKSGSSLDELKSTAKGKVYTLDKYTLLMEKRTQMRHQRRGYKRKQMVKRLFKLIWEKHFGFKWNNNVQQTISFLFNRRGFTFLTAEYDEGVLSQFPEAAYDLLPEKLKKDNIIKNEDGKSYDFYNALMEWSEDKNKIQNIYKELQLNHIIAKLEKEILKDPKKITKEFEISKEQLESIKTKGVKGLDNLNGSFTYTKEGEKKTVKYIYGNKVNLANYLKYNNNQIEKIKQSLSQVQDDNNLWDFNYQNFNLESAIENDKFNLEENSKTLKENSKPLKEHIHHLCFAIYKTYEELQSGSRYRSKYFQEIEDVLKSKEEHQHAYLKEFCKNLNTGEYKSEKRKEPLSEDELYKLICHLSNFELKPLRKYFNDENNKKEDQWIEERFTKLFKRWILKEWRVDTQKDKKKGKGKEGDYNKLKNEWKIWEEKNPKKVVGFFLKTKPILTIPPYQDNNNRRPPKCQSLILNALFLDKEYKDWNSWLDNIIQLQGVKEYLGSFKEDLKSLKTSSKKTYFGSPKTGDLKKDSGKRSNKDVDARILQFIFDRVKSEDPLKLNDIYSYAKKYKQLTRDKQDVTEVKESLEKALQNSQLTKELKMEIDYNSSSLFQKGSFLHLVCKYYKLRQRARAGRLFIHPKYRYIKNRGYENTGHFDDKNFLLTYCNHKPRQKKYQTLEDVASLFLISSKEFKEFLSKKYKGIKLNEDEQIEKWLSNIKGIKTNCPKVAKEQKNSRGSLKLNILRMYRLIEQFSLLLPVEKKQRDKKIIEQLKNKDKSLPDLYKLCKKSKELHLEILKNLYDDKRLNELKDSLSKNPASSVYFLIQINNLVFQNRSGNANTCSVCSLDNSKRMEQVEIEMDDRKEFIAKAQRLPAISTRLIDGAVMRMARILGKAIAQDKYNEIKNELKDNKKVCIPIITELNRFEFEPSLNALKGKKDKKFKEPFKEKEDRIQKTNKYCPYTGVKISNGEIDHIIARASKHGVLNDEANLIWASQLGNQHKTNTELSLSDLNKKYKEELFGKGQNDDDIKKRIIDQIGDGTEENFKFGKYQSFINLNKDQQKAFRHALFLKDEDIRKKVIQAISNRNKTFVNGTQRYFAEVLANELYKKTRADDKKQNLLSFDYFDIPSRSNHKEIGISNLRENYNLDPEIKKYEKQEGKKQKPYSHLIDAQIAFILAAKDHCDEGSLKLSLSNEKNEIMLYDSRDKKRYENNMFDKIKVDAKNMVHGDLSRRKLEKGFRVHRVFTRDTFYASHYLPILFKKIQSQACFKIGFSWGNSIDLKDKDFKGVKKLLKFFSQIEFCNQGDKISESSVNDFHELYEKLLAEPYFQKQIKNNEHGYLTVNKKLLHNYLVKNYNTKKTFSSKSDFLNFIKEIEYKTEKKKIKIEKVKNKKDDIESILKGHKFTIKEKIELPSKQEWKNLYGKWKASKKDKSEFNAFLKEYFKSNNKLQHHIKTRKVFSLPIVTGQGKLMVKRKSWNQNNIFQVINDSDSRKGDNKPALSVWLKDKSLGKALSEWVKSENIVKLPFDDYDEGEVIDSNKWWRVVKNKIPESIKVPQGIEELWYRVDDTTAPSIGIKLGVNGSDIDLRLIENGILAKKKKKKDTFFESIKKKPKGYIVSYKGKTFCKVIEERLLKDSIEENDKEVLILLNESS